MRGGVIRVSFVLKKRAQKLSGSERERRLTSLDMCECCVDPVMCEFFRTLV